MIGRAIIVALLCGILTLLMGFVAWFKGTQDVREKELQRQKAAWEAALRDDLKALPDSFQTPKWDETKDK